MHTIGTIIYIILVMLLLWMSVADLFIAFNSIINKQKSTLTVHYFVAALVGVILVHYYFF